MPIKKILYSITHFLFEDDEYKRLEKDLERRFRKPFQHDRSISKRIKYLKENIQYQTLLYYRLFKASRFLLFKRVFEKLYIKSSQRTGVEIYSPIVGGGVILPHWGRIIMHAEQIGENLYIFHNVTIGNDYASGKPKIGSNVFIGTGSVILGNISIGNNVIIGACSFVNEDIPSNSMVVGNPARVIKMIDDEYISRMLGY